MKEEAGAGRGADRATIRADANDLQDRWTLK